MTYLIIGIILFMFILNVCVDVLNYRYRHQPIPDNVKSIYDEKQYEIWKSYTMAHLKLSIIESTFGTVLVVLLLVFGVFGMIEGMANQMFQSPLMQNLMFLFIYILIFLVTRLPFKYVSVFKIEEAYGFNKTTKKTFVLDQFKSLLMIIVLGGGVFSLIHVIYTRFAADIWLFIGLLWASLSVIMLMIFFLNTKVFVKLFNKLTPLEDGSLRVRIEGLAHQLGFSVQKIFVMDASKRSTKLNAFFSGIGKTREVVLFDTLIQKMDENEVLAVLAHELGHATHKDIPRMLIQQVFMIGLYAGLIGLIMQHEVLSTSFGLSGFHLGFGLILFAILIEPLGLILGILTNYFSRKAEYKADRFAVTHTSKEDMKHALIKLFQENLSNLNPHPLYVILHYSHPEASKRLYAIEN